MNTRTSVDRLIDWYEKNRPDAGRTIRVKVTSTTVQRFAHRPVDGKYIYRGRQIVPLKKTARERRALGQL